MAEDTEKAPGWAESPLYEQAVTHFEAEEWEEAISLFSQLASEFPDDQELQRILADLRLKASLTREETGRGRMRIRRLGRRVLAGLGVVALIAVLAGVPYVIYTNWLLPARAQLEQDAYRREMHDLARGYLAAGDYAQASDLYREILSQWPDDETAAAGLERVEELQELAVAYDAALELTQQERWAEALQAWQAILAVDPNFRDVKYWSAFVEEQDVVGSLFVDAELRYEGEDWGGAIEVLEQLRVESINYRRDEVEPLLVGSLVKLAEQMLSEASDPTEVYDEVVALFDKALQIRPQNESVLVQQAVAEAYSQGCARFQEEDWEGAVEELQFAYQRGTDYAGGKVVQLLYQADIHCGDVRAEAGDLQGARACYEAAMELPLGDVTEASTKYAALVPMLTATPTRRPPVSTPTPTRRPRPPTPTSTLSPYRFVLVARTERPRTSCLEGGTIEGRIVDAGGRGLSGVWVRLQWWDNYKDMISENDGKFGFAPLAPENYQKRVPFLLTVIRSPSSPTQLSSTQRLDFQGCLIHSGFTNVTFKALY